MLGFLLLTSMKSTTVSGYAGLYHDHRNVYTCSSNDALNSHKANKSVTYDLSDQLRATQRLNQATDARGCSYSKATSLSLTPGIDHEIWQSLLNSDALPWNKNELNFIAMTESKSWEKCPSWTSITCNPDEMPNSTTQPSIPSLCNHLVVRSRKTDFQ